MRTLAITIAAFLIISTSAVGATRTWTGAATNLLWSNPLNWDGAAPLPDDDLVFPPGTTSALVTNDFPDGTRFNSVSVAPSYTLSGNRIVIGAGGLSFDGTPYVQLPLTLGGSQTWNSHPLGGAVFSGVIDLNGATLSLSGGSFSLSSTWVTGTGAIVMNASYLEITATSFTYTGPLTFNSGTISIGGNVPQAIQVPAGARAVLYTGNVAGGVSVADGGDLLIAGSAPTPPVTSGLTLAAGARTTVIYSGSVIVNGAVRLGGNLTVDSEGAYPPLGTAEVLIENDGSDPVVGTFAGLPEGAEIVDRDGRVHRISYTGGSGNDVTLTLLRAPAWIEADTSPDPSDAGTPVTLTARVMTRAAYPPPSGTVTFTDGSLSLGTAPLDATGTATLTTSSIWAGSRYLRVDYSGDGTHGTATTALVHRVTGIASETRMTAPPFGYAGLPVSFTVTVTAAAGAFAGGYVRIETENGLECTAPLGASGTATCTIASFTPGTYLAGASFFGDALHAGSWSEPVEVVIEPVTERVPTLDPRLLVLLAAVLGAVAVARMR